MWLLTIEEHSSLVIGYYKKNPAKTLVGGVSKHKKIRERVDSEGQYGRWRLRVMGSCTYISSAHWKRPGTPVTRSTPLSLMNPNGRCLLLVCFGPRHDVPPCFNSPSSYYRLQMHLSGQMYKGLSPSSFFRWGGPPVWRSFEITTRPTILRSRSVELLWLLWLCNYCLLRNVVWSHRKHKQIKVLDKFNISHFTESYFEKSRLVRHVMKERFTRTKLAISNFMGKKNKVIYESWNYILPPSPSLHLVQIDRICRMLLDHLSVPSCNN